VLPPLLPTVPCPHQSTAERARTSLLSYECRRQSCSAQPRVYSFIIYSWVMGLGCRVTIPKAAEYRNSL
jgi:hypothetical protein